MPIINRIYYHFRLFFSKNFPKVFSFCDQKKAIVKFFIAGAFASAVDLLALFIFYGLFSWGIVLSTSLAFLFSFIVSFSLQKLWTFRNYSHRRLPHQLVLYFSAAFISMNLNGLGMHFLVINLNVWYLLSQVIVNIFLGLINFFTYKFIVFRQTKEDEN